MSTQSPTKLIVVLAFTKDDVGELRSAFEPKECQSEDQARQQAAMLASSRKYDGVLAWWRSADLVNGEFGEPVEIFRWGAIPDME